VQYIPSIEAVEGRSTALPTPPDVTTTAAPSGLLELESIPTAAHAAVEGQATPRRTEVPTAVWALDATPPKIGTTTPTPYSLVPAARHEVVPGTQEMPMRDAAVGTRNGAPGAPWEIGTTTPTPFAVVPTA
jgi:hypothetical protein